MLVFSLFVTVTGPFSEKNYLCLSTELFVIADLLLLKNSFLKTSQHPMQ